MRAFLFTVLCIGTTRIAFRVLVLVFFPLTIWDIPEAVSMYVPAWLIGYVTVFAPVGFGVADATSPAY